MVSPVRAKVVAERVTDMVKAGPEANAMLPVAVTAARVPLTGVAVPVALKAMFPPTSAIVVV
jgi:hypothetical protein